MQNFQLFLKITTNQYIYWLAMVCCPKLHIIIYLSIKRFGDVDLAGKLNNADLCWWPGLHKIILFRNPILKIWNVPWKCVFFVVWFTDNKSKILFLQGLRHKSHVHLKNMILNLYIQIYLWCNKHRVLFSTPFNIFCWYCATDFLYLWQKLIFFCGWNIFSVFSDQNKFLWEKLVYVTETSICYRDLFLFLQKPISAT